MEEIEKTNKKVEIEIPMVIIKEVEISERFFNIMENARTGLSEREGKEITRGEYLERAFDEMISRIYFLENKLSKYEDIPTLDDIAKELRTAQEAKEKHGGMYQ